MMLYMHAIFLMVVQVWYILLINVSNFSSLELTELFHTKTFIRLPQLNVNLFLMLCR